MEADRAPAGVTATLRDVAAAAGVHAATASRALNPDTRALVNADTAQRVLDAAAALGYRPNPIARGLKTSRSYTIGVVVPDLRNPLFPRSRAGSRTGWSLPDTRRSWPTPTTTPSANG